jgi:hypothetical protein
VVVGRECWNNRLLLASKDEARVNIIPNGVWQHCKPMGHYTPTPAKPHKSNKLPQKSFFPYKWSFFEGLFMSFYRNKWVCKI